MNGKAGEPRGAKGKARIEGLVPSKADRELVKRAAAEAGKDARRFVGDAALAAARGPELQIARLEDVTAAQQEITAELLRLRDDMVEAARLCRESVRRHEETHERLAEALSILGETVEKLKMSLDGHDCTHRKLDAVLKALGDAADLVSRLARDPGGGNGEAG